MKIKSAKEKERKKRRMWRHMIVQRKRKDFVVKLVSNRSIEYGLFIDTLLAVHMLCCSLMENKNVTKGSGLFGFRVDLLPNNEPHTKYCEPSECL